MPKPLTIAQTVAAANRWREQYNPLRGLTLSRAITLSEAYFRGDMADLQWAYFFVEQTDADLLALIECRHAPLLEMDWEIKLADPDEEEQATADAQKDFLRERFDRIDNLYEAIEHLAMASFRGFAHCELWYEKGELFHLEPVDQWNAIRDGMRGPWKYNPEAQSTTFAGLGDDLLMLPEAFLFREVRRPINRIALFKFIRESLSDKDWDAFIEIYGIPGGVITGPPNVPEGKEAEYQTAAEAVAEGGSGYIPNGSEYTPNDGPRGNQPFEARLKHLSAKLILAGTGGKLTMLAESGSGTLAGGAHMETFERIAKGEARKISEILHKQLGERWLAEKFPGQKPLAYFELELNKETDVGDIIEHVAKLKTAGYQVDPVQVAEDTGYKVTLVADAPPETDDPEGEATEDENDPAAGNEPEAEEAPDAEEDEPEKKKAVRNREQSDDRREEFGRAEYANALADDLAPVRELIESHLARNVFDPAAILAELDAQEPELLAQLSRRTGSADVLAGILGVAVITGADEALRELSPTRPNLAQNEKDAL